MVLKDWLIRVSGRRVFRTCVVLACPSLILWLGIDAIDRISELYDGLCVIQGPGMKILLTEDNNPLGYCTGIGSDLGILNTIVGVAAASIASALGGFWYWRDNS